MVVYLAYNFILLSSFLFTSGQYRGCYDEDTYWSCYYSLISGMCTNRYYADQMYRTCRSTCNLCPKKSFEMSEEEKLQKSNMENECKDEQESCLRWKKHCSGGEYYDYMTTNCRRTCLFCADENCNDESKNCGKYYSYGYCHLNHRYYSYMKKNCPKSCEFCLHTEQKLNKTLPVDIKKEFSCQFEEHTCDWENSHFEDTADWLVGMDSNGPRQGYNATANYLYLDAKHTHMEAKLWLPWQLIFPSESEDHGVMCLNFYYQLTGGKLIITQNAVPTAVQKFPRPTILLSTDKKHNTWTHVTLNVHVNDKYQLYIIGQKGLPQTYIVVDDLFFIAGKC